MDLIEFNNAKYPKFQSLGNASQFSIPFAKVMGMISVLVKKNGSFQDLEV